MNKKWILNLITFLLVCSFVISGCKFFYSSKLRAPVVIVNEETMTLIWDTNYNASGYEIQMNETIIATIESEGDRTQYTYSYADVIGQFGEFRFRVKCIGSGKYADSDLSQAVVVKIGSAISYLNKNITEVAYSFDDNYDVTDVSVNNNVLSWAESTVPNLSGYLVSIYTNTLGIKHYESVTNSLELTNAMLSNNDILAIKVCSVIGGVNYEPKEIFYYNPLDAEKYGVYTDTIYLFDGEVYDYYIENWDELQNLYYYAFIYRIEDVNFMVSDDFHDAYENTYFDTLTGKADDYIIGNGNTAYFETAGFKSSPTLISTNYLTNEFRLSCRYEDFNKIKEGVNTEPSVEGVAYFTQDIDYTPYYETVDYEKRDENYDNFESDNWYLETTVNSSEELFWAVSTHITPIFEDNTSRAYLIYEEAKNVLKEIISDEMTDYEKAVSIFDYIMLNTTYDYNTFKNNTIDNPMKYMCYYLEGVFLSGNKLSVCDGYSKAYALLCNMEGINCVRIMGSASGGGHAWNKVEINGNWFVVDITWTAISQDTSDNGIYDPDEEVCSHTYFLISDQDISETHTAFSNRYIFSLLNARESFDYYINDKLLVNEKSLTRIITKVDELKEILTNMVIDNYKGAELIIDASLYVKFGGDISSIVKSAKEYSFIALEFGRYGGLYYDSNDITKEGLLLIVRPSITISTDVRYNEFISFVQDCKIERHDKITLSTSKINEWIGDNYSTEEEKITALEEYFNNDLGQGISVQITRVSEDITEEVYTQDEHGNWVTTTMTSGEYSFEFVYSE